MNKRYMDFVPKRTEKIVKKPVIREEEVAIEPEPLVEDAVTFEQEEPNYGVIEDFRPKFVRTMVKKRPLNSPDSEKSEIDKIKAKKLIKRGDESDKKAVEPEKKLEDKKILRVPKTRFVNTEKIEKRPLSKNIYKKKVAPAKERVEGPVTIISKPEKDSKVGIVVAIILTIMLGAAAGTVAFLLLPK